MTHRSSWPRLILACLVLFAACASPRGAAVGRLSPAARPPLTILHFNDVYEITPVEGGRSGGLARVAAYRRHLADSLGAVLTTLGGDFLSPSALGTARVDGERLAGRQMVAVLNAAGVDWATLGNHEFDVPEQAFRARLGESRFRYVISNVTDSAGRLFAHTTQHAIVRVGDGARGVRVGLVGVVLDANKQPWVRYSDPYEAARVHVAMIRDSVDIVIAITHLAIAQDQVLAERVPGIDLIVGGHEHENYLLQRGPHFTPIVKGDANARTVAVISIHPGAGGGRARIVSTLVPITDAMPSDSAVEAEVLRWIERAFAGYRAQGFAPDEVIATSTAPLDGREATVRTRAGSLSDLVLAALRREAPDAEVALFNGGSIRIDDVIPPGPVTQYDVIRILPFGGASVRVDMSGRLLRQVLAAGRGNIGSGGFLHASGATLSPDGALSVAGAAADDERRYRVVLSDFLLTGAETNLGFLTRTNAELSVVRELRDIRMSLIDQLRRP
ncbi:MAG: bifunctional metallophosphatase/5'-nucleotidase [Gemmatimonadaceae bacterium]